MVAKNACDIKKKFINSKKQKKINSKFNKNAIKKKGIFYAK